MKTTLSLTDRVHWLGAVFLLAIVFPAASEAGGPLNHVWFEGEALNSSSSVLNQGRLGEDLQLGCQNSIDDAACQWSITMRMRSEMQFGAMGTNLMGDTNKSSITNIVHGNFPSNAYNFQAINSAGKLASFKEVNIPVTGDPPQFDYDDGAAGDYLLATFQLNTQKLRGDMSVLNIDAAINNLLWAAVAHPGNPPPAYVQFGSYPPIHGGINGLTAFGVIAIHTPDLLDGGSLLPIPTNIPEPSALLILAVLLFRPRRR